MNSSPPPCPLSNRLSTIDRSTIMKISPGLLLFVFSCISSRKIFVLEMNSLYHFNLPIQVLVFRKRHDVRYLKGFGDFLRRSSRIRSQRILLPTTILKYLNYRLLARPMRLMAVFSRLFNQYTGHKHAMSLRMSNYI